MKKSLFILLLVPVVLYCAGKPKIKFEALSHDFGTQEQNIRLTHVFAFTNTGDGLLTIGKIEAG